MALHGVQHTCMQNILFGAVLLCSLTGIALAQNDCNTGACYPPVKNLLSGLATGSWPNRTVTASSTCGVPDATTYQKIDSVDMTNYICNSSDPALAYPVHPNIYDSEDKVVNGGSIKLIQPKLSTYWQSQNALGSPGGIPEVFYIYVDLTDTFLITNIRVIFVCPHATVGDTADARPSTMGVEYTDDNGKNWNPYRFFSEDCSRVTWMATESPGSAQHNGPTVPVCYEGYYHNDVTTSVLDSTAQLVKFAPSDLFSHEFYTDYNVQLHYTKSSLRLHLREPADKVNIPRSYYAIANLEISGRCQCFGHASQCTGVNDATCLCQHNTMGQHCEFCQPLYNNRPWVMAEGKNKNECQDCGCNGHATSCHYDASKGYGICDSCSHNSIGEKCEICPAFYYDSLQGGNKTGRSWECLDCACNRAGTLQSSNYLCHNVTGQCDCVKNVEGRACDTCKDTFWNLNVQNSDGCQSCDCDTAGSLYSKNFCNKTTGVCICKELTKGVRCTECARRAYGLTKDNPKGCTLCLCDPGGTWNPNLDCDPNTGYCQCRGNIRGRNCKEPFSNYFVPKLDFLTVEAEDATYSQGSVEELPGDGHGGRGVLHVNPQATMSADVEINSVNSVPYAQNFNVVIRYKSNSTWPSVRISFSSDDATSYACNNIYYEAKKTHRVTGVLLQSAEQAVVTLGSVCLLSDAHYTMTINVNNDNSTSGDGVLSLDSISLLPNLPDVPLYKKASPEDQQKYQTCYEAVLASNSSLRNSCVEQEYAVMAELYKGAIGCSCDTLGTVPGSICDSHGGQCQCKPGVTGLKCDRCETFYYGFDSGNGCTACNCDSNGSLSPYCDTSGVCQCKGNVTRDKCDDCLDGYFGLHTGQGCERCVCNPLYAVSNSCDDFGQCPCKPGVWGLECDQCQDGYYGLQVVGCSQCTCSFYGSVNSECDKNTGACSCKANTQGALCDQCKQGFFAPGDWHSEGCLPCFCSGHSNSCTSSPDFFQSIIQDTWSLLDNSAVEPFWDGVDIDGTQVETKNDFDLSFVKKIVQIPNTGANMAFKDIFFQSTDKYNGDQRGAYGQYFSFELSTTSSDEWGNSSHGDVILQGSYVDFMLVASLDERPMADITNFTFLLHESVWRLNSSSGSQATYQDLMKILADVKAILIRGKYSNVSGAVTTLYSVKLQSASTVSGSVKLNNVEQCTCPVGYQGQYCESCAPGYKREIINGGPYTRCVPCECNGHSVPGRVCNSDTGACTCRHNTGGDYCETCLDGYYGNATLGTADDCKPCMCPGNVITGAMNAFASTCTLGPDGAPVCDNCEVGYNGTQCQVCDNNWYGDPTDINNNAGKCTPCNCNGFADTCDPDTGVCVNCQNNTAGKECDRCADGFYGNALNNDCKACNCSSIAGSTGECDHVTGHCVCKANVEGDYCDRCVQYAFSAPWFGGACQLCECNPAGSKEPTCHETTGQCQCKGRVIGRQCDQCEDKYWNLNNVTGCDPCDCEAFGFHFNGGDVCDKVTGQCGCIKPSVIGRRCDQCAAGTTKDYKHISGVTLASWPACGLCGECFDSWADAIELVGDRMVEHYNIALDIWKHYDNMTAEDYQQVIGELQENITGTQNILVQVQTMNVSLNAISAGFMQVSSEVVKLTTVIEYMEANRSLIQQALVSVKAVDSDTTIGDSSIKKLERENDHYQREYNRLSGEANSSDTSVQGLISQLRGYNQSMQQFITAVANAMQVLAAARQDREAAGRIIDGSFHTEREQLSGVISTLNNQMNNIQASLDNLKIIASNNEFDATTARNEATQAETLVGTKLDRVKSDLAASQMAKLNASQAQQAAEVAQSTALSYKELAQQSRANITSALEVSKAALAQLNNVKTEATQALQLGRQVNNMGMRTVNDIRSLTQQINATSVPEQRVNDIYAQAQQGVQTAEDALAVTQLAMNESHMALEQVTNIQTNLQQAATLRSQTQQLVGKADGYIATANGVVNQVNTKASNADNLATQTSTRIQQLFNLISTTNACINNIKNGITAAKNTADNAKQTVDGASQSHFTTQQNLNTLTNQVASRRSTTQQQQADLLSSANTLQGLNEGVDRVVNTFRHNELVNTVTGLLNEYTQQKQAMDSLDAELDVLLQELESLSPTAETCTNP